MRDAPDIVSFFIALIALISSSELAHLVGPYAAITVLSSAGAVLSLSTGPKLERMESVKFVSVRILVAFVLTVGLAEAIEALYPALKARYTLIPLAFLIGWIRDYRGILKSITDRVKGVFNAK